MRAAPSTLATHMRYAIVIERANDNFSAYAPDLPGCVAAGATLNETEQAIRESAFIRRQSATEAVATDPTSVRRARGV